MNECSNIKLMLLSLVTIEYGTNNMTYYIIKGAGIDV